MTTQTAKKFDILNGVVSKKLESTNSKIQENARRELILCARSNHNTGLMCKKSKFNGEVVSIVVTRGEFFTTYKQLCDIWNCTRDQARYQLEKWQANGTVKVDNIKDKNNFDLGLLITYNWLFNQEKERKAKIPTRETNQKTRQYAEKKLNKKSFPTHKYELLPKGNIEKTTKKESKKEVVFLYKTDLDFQNTAKQLEAIGFNSYRIEKFYNSQSQETLEKYLQLLELGRERVKNPCAWFTQAIRQAFDLQRVDNWRDEQKEQEKAEAERQEQEERERQEQEEQEAKAKKQADLIQKWRQANGQEQEEKLILEVLEDWRNNRRILYDSLLRLNKNGQDLTEYAKQNAFVKAEVVAKILFSLQIER